MTQVQTYYRPSGISTGWGLALINLVGVASALVFGVIYGYATQFIPYVYLKILATLALGAGLGWIIGKTAWFGHIRNPFVYYYFGFLFGLCAVYIGWVAWLHASSKQAMLVLAPVDLFKILRVIASNGVWSLSGHTVKGGLLYLFWLIEALLIVGLSTMVAGFAQRYKVFCETCKKWLNTTSAIFPLEPYTDYHQLQHELEAGNFSTLLTLKKIHPLSKHFTRLNLSLCSHCNNFHLLTVADVEKYISKRGTEKENENIFCRNLIIDATTYQHLVACDKPYTPEIQEVNHEK